MPPVMRAYRPAMSIRKLLALVLAVAVLVAPALTRAGEAFAAVPGHQLQMMEGGHCTAAPSADRSGTATNPEKSSGHDQAAGKSCCMSMCMAVAIAPPAMEPAIMIHGPGPTFALAHQYHGRITEIATPPPRRA